MSLQHAIDEFKEEQHSLNSGTLNADHRLISLPLRLSEKVGIHSTDTSVRGYREKEDFEWLQLSRNPHFCHVADAKLALPFFLQTH